MHASYLRGGRRFIDHGSHRQTTEITSADPHFVEIYHFSTCCSCSFERFVADCIALVVMTAMPLQSIRPALARVSAPRAPRFVDGAAAARSFASSSTARLPEAPSAGDTPASNRKPQLRKTPLGRFNISYLEEFQFDDNTSLGFMRLERMRERVELVKKIEADRAILQSKLNASRTSDRDVADSPGQRKAFQPPTAPIRIRSTIDLANPSSSAQQKQVLLVPVAALPLKTPEAIHRAKHIAGPRWSPGRPGVGELELETEQGLREAGVLAVKGGADIGKHGWIKMSEETFPDSRMNRRKLGDTLERLVTAANVSFPRLTLTGQRAMQSADLIGPEVSDPGRLARGRAAPPGPPAKEEEPVACARLAPS